MTAEQLLVPVGESVTLRQTVSYAVRSAVESGAETLHLVYVVPFREIHDGSADGIMPTDESVLDRAAVWARSDAEEGSVELDVRTSRIGADVHLFSPSDYADQLQSYAADHGIDRIVLDPEYDPGVGGPLLRPLEYQLTRSDSFRVEEAPVEPRTRRSNPLTSGSVSKYVAVFGISYLFYLTLGGFSGLFDVVTGAISAGLVAVTLARVSFAEPPRLRRSVVRLLRWSVYVPYLLYEIVKANLLISYVILHPDLPIDPRMTELRAALWEDLPVTTLANSITLTPGTLSVRVRGQHMLVHSLIAPAREGLFDGALERAVRYVFYGRDAARIASPRERGDAAVLDPDGEPVVEDDPMELRDDGGASR